MPRKSSKSGSSYYAGGVRFVRDGIPCRMAPWVAELTDNGRKLLLRGSDNPKPCEATQTFRFPQTKYLPAL